MLESAIVSRIVKALKERGCFVVKLHGGGMQRAGLPDLMIVYQGRAIFLEVKQPGEQATKLQEHTLDQIRQAGGIAAVVSSVDEALRLIHFQK